MHFKCTVAIIFLDDECPIHQREREDFFKAIPEYTKNIRYVIFKHFEKSTITKVIVYQNSKIEMLDLGFTDIYNPATLTEFFNNYVLAYKDKKVKSERHLLLTWGHGAGLGFFNRANKEKKLQEFLIDVTGDQKEKANTIFKNLSDEIQEFAFLKASLSLDITFPANFIEDKLPAFISGNLKNKFIAIFDEKVNVITADQFNLILENSYHKTGNTKVDLFIATNCYMQMLETGYCLKENVKYLLSAQNLIPYPGFDYRSLFNLLEANYCIVVEAIWENIKANFRIKYQTILNTEYILRSEYSKMKLTCSLFKLEDAVFFRDSLNNLAEQIISNFCLKLEGDVRMFEFLQEFRERIPDLSEDRDRGFVDFLTLLSELHIDFKRSNQLPQARHLIDSISVKFQNAIKNFEENNATLYSMNGLSLFFPNSDYAQFTYTRLFINWIENHNVPNNGYYYNSNWWILFQSLIKFWDTEKPNCA